MVQNLMKEKIEMNDANIIEDYEDESISKYVTLFKETSEKLSKLKETKTITRNEIFIKALNEFRNLNWVEEELAKNSLDPIRIRRPDEVVLKFALLCNSMEKAPKYNYKGFISLWNDLSLQKNRTWKQDSNTSETLTFQQIFDIVKENKYNDEKQIWQQTLAVTQEISDDLNTLIDFEGDSVVEDFKTFFEKYIDKFADASQSGRYYFFKYLYFLIVHEIGELKDTLLWLTEDTWNNKIDEIFDNESDTDDSDSPTPRSDYFEKIDANIKRNKMISALYNVNDHPEAFKVQGSRVILSNILSNFLLFGVSQTDKHFKLFDDKNTTLSHLNNQTKLFSGGRKKEEHNKIVENLKNTVVEDFYGYKVSLNKAYNILFNSSFSDVTSQDDKLTTNKEKGHFVLNIYKSRYDISRSTMLLFLLSLKFALFDTEKYLYSTPFFNKTCEINYTNVNKLLKRMGYVPIGFNSGTERAKLIDKLYKKLFSAPKSEHPEILGVLYDFMDILKEEDPNYEDYEFLPVIPFETSKTSARMRREKFLEGE